MKKIILGFIFLSIAFVSFGQGKISAMWSSPAAFRADEEVTLFFDVSGTQLEGDAGPLYLWTWNPSDPAAGNGAWDNSPEHMELDHVEGNIWSFTMTPTVFYGKSVEEITQIFGLLKTKDGSKKTDDFKEENGDAIVLFDFSVMENEIVRVVPANFRGDRPVSIIFNVANAWSEGGSSQGQLVGKQPSAHSGINGWQNVVASDDASNKQDLTNIGGDLWRLDMVPHEYYNTTAVITEINMVLNNNGDWAASARDVGGADFTLKPQLPGPEPEKEYRWFPGMFTVDDIFTLYFNQNATEVEALKTASEVYYVITANEMVAEGKLKSIGGGRFSVSLILSRVFNNADEISSFEFYFKNVDGSVTTEPVTIDNKVLVPLD